MTEKMRAIVKTEAAPGLEMVLTDIPPVGPRDILVKVKATSICGTDRHIYKWDSWAQGRIKVPLTIGHEFCGHVVEIGRDVTLVKVGDFVSADSHIPDYTCHVCRNGQPHICANLLILGVDTRGCFSDYAVVPETIAWKNDPDLDPAMASIQDPIGNSVYTVLAEPITGKSVAIFGDGPTGCAAVGIARASGASTIYHIGKYPFRLDIGKKMGADVSLNIKEEGIDVVGRIMEDTHGQGVDVTLEMSGGPQAIRDGLAILRKGGRFSAFGIPSDPVRLDLAEGVVFKGVRILGINGRLLWESWFQLAGLMRSGAFNPMPIITHKIAFEDFESGFRAMNAEDRQVCKVVMYPDPADLKD
jgi:threonine 3-dehydrogenase